MVVVVMVVVVMVVVMVVVVMVVVMGLDNVHVAPHDQQLGHR